ncbi:hypothetical protein Ciccas_007974, partial [Cichlidogyrus casuarinus]
MLERYLGSQDIFYVRIAHKMLMAVGIFLRKENFTRYQKLSDLCSKIAAKDFEMRVEVEDIQKILSLKKSNEECIKRSEQLKKKIKTWSQGLATSSISRLGFSLKDVESIPTKGRWWHVGSSYHPDKDQIYSSKTAKKGPDFQLDAQFEESAKVLGFETPFRQKLFQILVSTSGGPDATAATLLKACSTTTGSHGVRSAEHKEREMIQLVLHCLLSEHPFNQFYAR